MGDGTRAPTQIISLPQGGGALRGLGEKFFPDLHTGTGNFTVPITVPAGRRGHEPKLDLVYSTGNGNGYCGLGWTLTVPGVARNTSRGVPTYDDELDTFILSGAEDLVPVDRADPHQVRYRPRTEGLFARIVHHKNPSTGVDHWEVASRDGLVSRYGSVWPDGPQAHRPDPATIVHPEGAERVFAWKLTETRDPFGNLIVYEYDNDDGHANGHRWCQPLLRRICYADYTLGEDTRFFASVTFHYDVREDAFSDYRAGFEIRNTRLCRAISTMTHADKDRAVRRYELDYETDPYNGVSLLRSVQVVGFDDEGAEHRDLPPLEFEYSRFVPEDRSFQPIRGADPPPASLARGDYELVDLTGDGLPDVLELSGSARYWRNMGEGVFDRPRPMRSSPTGLRLSDPGVQLLDADGDGRADLLVTTLNFAGYFTLRFDARWGNFRPYKSAPSFNLEDPQVRLVDLTGNGVTDVLRAGARLECWFHDPETGWTGPRAARRLGPDPLPELSFTDPRVKLADMTGDGLQDIVLVYSGNIVYWPNLGHGRWGTRLRVPSSPRLPDGYDPARVLLGDVSGDGSADLVYVDDDHVMVWFNRSGNGWSEPIIVKGTPTPGIAHNLRVVDLLGTGTGGILFSRDSQSAGRPSMFFLDLTGGVKPRLLTRMDNNIGAVTEIDYASSARFALTDAKRSATSWRTPLPIVVSVVARVTVYDQVSHGKLVTEYCYHHGYWDGVEREFRGFGRVDQVDTQTLTTYHASRPHRIDFVPVDEASFSPPTITKNWFHLGPVGDEEGDWSELDWTADYWTGDPNLLRHTDKVNAFLRGLHDPVGRGDRRARRDALRALRGSVLRTELYGLDNSTRQDLPYTVTEHAYDVREESSAGERGRPRVFFPLSIAERTTQWERGTDPMTRFTYTGHYDRFGHPRRETTVAPPRRRARRRLVTTSAGTFAPDEWSVLATHTRTVFAEPTQDIYIHDRVAQVRTYELANALRVDEGDLASVAEMLSNQARTAEAVCAIFDGLAASDVRMTGHVLNYYDGPAYEGRKDQQVGPHGALTRSETLVLTDELLEHAYGAWWPDFLGGPQLLPAGAPSGFGTALGYRRAPISSADTTHEPGWYADTIRQAYDVQLAGPGNPGRGVVLGVQDPLGHETRVTPDAYWLLPNVVRDPAGLETVAAYNYRVGRPHSIADPNRHVTNYRYHPLGLVAAVFLQGRDGEGSSAAQPEIGYTHNLTAFADGKQPISVHTARRVWHTHENVSEEVIESREYSDGFGRLVQQRLQADELTFGATGDDAGLLVPDAQGTGRPMPGRDGGPAIGARVADRVVVSGWQVYDNKGRVIERYEPFFDSAWDYQPERQARRGRRVSTFYDPLGQVVRVVNPDGSERWTIFGVPSDFSNPHDIEPTPWAVTVYDENDLAALSARPDGTSLAGAAPHAHHFTPATTIVDALGRAVCHLARGGGEPGRSWHSTRTRYDIRGNVTAVTDELGRTAFRHAYDLTNRSLLTDSIDSGVRTSVIDAGGNLVQTLDARGCITLRTYDVLNRLSGMFARDRPELALTLRELRNYGDDPAGDLSTARKANRLGRLWRCFDSAGLLTTESYDFTGNATEEVRRVVSDAAIAAAEPSGWTANWARPDAATALDPREYRTTSRYDALGRMVRVTTPTDVNGHRAQIVPAYGRSGALRSITVDGTPYIRLLVHNARGQRVLIAYGDGTSNGTGPGLVTRYAYDPDTFRLSRLRSERMTPAANGRWTGSGAPAQDLTYTYDLVGNLTAIEERTPACGVAGSADGRDRLVRTLTYDAYYRLVSATGRACSDIGGLRPLKDDPRCGWYDSQFGTTPAAPTQANAPNLTTGYCESYTYDPAGNLLDLGYQVTTGTIRPNWHRMFGLGGLPPDQWADAPNNRLTSVRTGSTTTRYSFDAAGNIRAENAERTYVWDHASHLVGFRIQAGDSASVAARYLYGADGTRVKKWVRRGGAASMDETTVYIGSVAEHHQWRKSGGGENSLLHVLDGTSRLALIRTGPAHPDDAGSPVRYELVDHLGSASLSFDSGGTWTNREEYFPYGETSFGSFARKRYRYTGNERDEESGLAYHAARYFAPSLARWISPDPTGPAAGTSAYGYARASPLGAVDRMGLATGPPPHQVTANAAVGSQVKQQQLDVIQSRGNVAPMQEVTTKSGAGGSRLDAITATVENTGVRSQESTSMSVGKAGGAYRDPQGQLKVGAIRARINAKVDQVLKHIESLKHMKAELRTQIEAVFGKVPSRENLLITVRGASQAEVGVIRKIAQDVFTKIETKIRPGIGVISEKLGTGVKSVAPALVLTGVQIIHEGAEERARAERLSSDWPSADVIEHQRRAGYEFRPVDGRPAWTYEPGTLNRVDTALYELLQLVTDPTFLGRKAGLIPENPFGGEPEIRIFRTGLQDPNLA